MRTNDLSRSYAHSTSFKLALFFTVLCTVALLILGYFAHFFARGHYERSSVEIIKTEASHIKLWDEDGKLEKILKQRADQDDRLFYVFHDTDKQKIVSNIEHLPFDVIQVLKNQKIAVFKYNKNQEYYAASLEGLEDQKTIFIAININKMRKDYLFMAWLSELSIFAMLMIIIVSFLISTFVVTRIRRISHTAQNIIHTGDLSQRIKINSRWDDIGYMTQALNTLLGRIEHLMSGVKNVSDSIAHDLRTPLTRMRNDLEQLASSKEQLNIEQQQNAFLKIRDEADHILSTFNAILRISKIENEQLRDKFIEFNIKDIAHDIYELYEPLADDKGIDFTYEAIDAPYYGDRDLLFQAISNLIDNALKFTQEGGKVKFVLTWHEAKYKIYVLDTGPGISDADKDRVFERFYRGEKSRNQPGNGLGMSLVAAIAKLHGGEVMLDNQEHGLKVSLIL